MGAHAPSKPEVNVRGRSEMHITWRPPEVPLGRIFRYEVLCNGEVMYSGTDLHCVIRQLRSDTEYLISVCAVTSEGKCESKCTKKRTAKDEFEGERAPLYQAPVKTDNEKKSEHPKSSKKRKSIGGSTSNSNTGATDNPRKANLSRANSASQASQNKKDKENTDAPSATLTRTASSHHQEAAPDKNESQSKKSSNELKRLQSVLGSKMPKQKGQADGQESDLSRPKPMKLRSGHRRTSASRVIFQSHDQMRTSTGDVSQNKMCTAKSEEEEPKCQYSRRASHPHVRQSDCSNRLGLTRRGINQDKSLSHSMPEGFVDITIETLPMMHNGKQDTDISWIAHNRRAELQEGLAHVYSAAGLPAQCKPTQALKPGVMEFECPENIPHSAGSGKLRYGPMNYVQRASTFVSGHRPSTKKPLDKIRNNAPSFSQLTPELTLPASLTVRNHNKFVPMQFRTQPANLPSALSRQNTQIAPENSYSHLDTLSRSQSDVSTRLVDNNYSSPRPTFSVPNSAIKHKERILSSSGTKQLLSKTLSADFAATAQSAELQNGTILVSPHDVPSGESIMGIGVSTTHENNTLQSAR